MKLGIATFVTDESMRIDDLARALEERGFDALFVPEHSHIPVSRESPYPAGGDLPHSYYRSVDPFVALGAAAAITQRLELGTGICLVVQRDPIHTAKMVATLDRISDGRFLFGVAPGWNREEMRHHGTDPATRTKLLEERVHAMRRLWSEEQAEFHGELVDFAPSYQWPKPVQPGGPPVLVGGMAPAALDRVLAYGDGWLPNLLGQEHQRFVAMLTELRRRAAEVGRSVPVTLLGAAPTPAVLAEYAGLGVERSLMLVPPLSGDAMLGRLDELAALRDAVPAWRPHL